MPTRISSKISLDGPFFRHDPRKQFRANIRVFTASLAAEGQEDVRQQLRAGEGRRRPVRDARPNRVSGHVIGRIESLKGKDWQVTAVVSINNQGQSAEGGIQLMAAASSLEGRTHAIRKTFNRIRRTRKANEAELMKGLQ